MKKAVFLILFVPNMLLGQISTVAQEQSRVNAMNELMKDNTSSLMLYYKPSEVDVNGSKYFHDTYVTGELWFTNGDYASTGYLFKYDESENSVQVKDKAGQEVLTDADKINGCKLNIEGKSVFYFKAQVPGSPNKKRLFQLIYNNEKYRVIKLPSKKLITKTKIFHDDANQYEYISQHTYYLKKEEGHYIEVKLRKKSLLDAFPEKKAVLSKLFETPAYKERLNEASFAAILMELDKKNP
jgi:hypothetical protein